MKKYGFIGVLLLFFVIFSTNVLSNVEVISITNTITASESGNFNVIIKNTDTTEHTYFLNMPMFLKWTSYYSFPNEGIKLSPGNSHEFEVKLTPLNVEPNIYQLFFNVFREDKVSYEDNFKLFVYPSKPAQYGPSISLVVDIKDTINPQEKQIITLNIKNNNPLIHDQLKINIKSAIPEFNSEQFIQLGANEKKTIQFTIDTDRFTDPGKYILFFTIGTGNKTYEILEKNIVIGEKDDLFSVTLEDKSGFFIVKENLKVHNLGNVKNTQKIKYPANFFDRIISSSDNSKIRYIDDSYYFTWELTLSPNEYKNIEIRTNYVYPLVLLLAIALGILFYFKYIKKPIIAIKSPTKVDFDKGSITGAKISLTIKNLTKKEISNINIIDRLPKLMTYKEGEGFETLKPSFLKNKKGEILLKWFISQLDPKEERIITYGVKSNLNIVGEVTIMPTQITYEVDEKPSSIYSNKIKIRTRN